MALLLYPPAVSVIMSLTQHACWLLEVSLEHLSRASPRTPSLTPAVPRGHPAPGVPLLPMSQTLGWGRGLSPLSTDLGPKPLRDVAHQDSICVFGDCSQHQPRWNLSSSFSLEMLQSPRCPFVDALPAAASQWAQVPAAGCKASGSWEGLELRQKGL